MYLSFHQTKSQLNLHNHPYQLRNPQLSHYLLLCILLYSCSPSTRNQQNDQQNWSEEDRQELLTGLRQSGDDLNAILATVSQEQWFYQPDSSWSVASIVEHLGLQQDMHYREVYVLSLLPVGTDYSEDRSMNDEAIRNYENDPKRGTATWNVTPRGRWCTKEDAINDFNFVRDKMIEFVNQTDIDLRRKFTYRNLESEDYRSQRDLHQIILTTVSHTKRHTNQIKALLDQREYRDVN